MTIVDLGLVPFYWRTKTRPGPDESGIPQRLPFAFDFDSRLQLVIQHRRQDVLHWLKVVYGRDANVGYLQEGHALADDYGLDFLDFFARSATSEDAKGSLAEIGCGGVYLLSRLRTKGYDVVGIDPSPVTIRAGERAGIRVIPEFFPSPSISGSFDVIVHYDVLEHAEDPVAFLRAHHRHLNEGGEIVLAVPDCTTYITTGDIAMMLHEHLNYFDEESLELTLREAGFLPTAIERSSHGGVLFCRAKVGSGKTRPLIGSSGKFNEFERIARATRKSVNAFVRVAQENGAEMGCYVPLRAFPYLGKTLLSSCRLRFFDDDPGLRGHFFDGIDLPIENFDDLAESPPEYLIVFSRAFGNEIRTRVEAATNHQTTVINIGDLTDGL